MQGRMENEPGNKHRPSLNSRLSAITHSRKESCIHKQPCPRRLRWVLISSRYVRYRTYKSAKPGNNPAVPAITSLPRAGWRVRAPGSCSWPGACFFSLPAAQDAMRLASRTSLPQSLSCPGPASINGIKASSGLIRPSASAPSPRAAKCPLSTSISGLSKLPRI